MNIKKDDMMPGSLMPVKVAVDEAMVWWEKHGRDLMRFKRESQESMSKGAFNVKDVDDPNFIPSGVIAGRPWIDLSREEKLLVVKAWYAEWLRNGPRKS